MKRRERVYAERRKNVREVCRHYDSGKRWKNDTQGDKFYFDLKNGLAMCTNAKVLTVSAVFCATAHLDQKYALQLKCSNTFSSW